MKPDPFIALAGEHYISLTTYRRSGEPVATPVWFATAGGRLYIRTVDGSGKVKRLRANPMVTVAPCTIDGKVTGAAIPATAHVLPDNDPANSEADSALDAKYGEQRQESTRRLAEKGFVLVVLAIEPAHH